MKKKNQKWGWLHRPEQISVTDERTVSFYHPLLEHGWNPNNSMQITSHTSHIHVINIALIVMNCYRCAHRSFQAMSGVVKLVDRQRGKIRMNEFDMHQAHIHIRMLAKMQRATFLSKSSGGRGPSPPAIDSFIGIQFHLRSPDLDAHRVQSFVCIFRYCVRCASSFNIIRCRNTSRQSSRRQHCTGYWKHSWTSSRTFLQFDHLSRSKKQSTIETPVLASHLRSHSLSLGDIRTCLRCNQRWRSPWNGFAVASVHRSVVPDRQRRA